MGFTKITLYTNVSKKGYIKDDILFHCHALGLLWFDDSSTPPACVRGQVQASKNPLG